MIQGIISKKKNINLVVIVGVIVCDTVCDFGESANGGKCDIGYDFSEIAILNWFDAKKLSHLGVGVISDKIPL